MRSQKPWTHPYCSRETISRIRTLSPTLETTAPELAARLFRGLRLIQLGKLKHVFRAFASPAAPIAIWRKREARLTRAAGFHTPQADGGPLPSSGLVGVGLHGTGERVFRHFALGERFGWNAGLDHQIDRPADQEEVLDVVAPDQHKLAAAIQMGALHIGETPPTRSK